MVPKGWKLVTIGNLTSSHSYDPRFSAKDYDVNGTVKTIRNTDITETGEILYEQVPTAQLDSEIVEQHKLKTGDLIIITTADCGLSAIFEEQDIAYIPSAYAVRYRLNQTVLPTFIKYFMHASIAQKQVGKFIRKGTVANLPGSDVLKIKVALPPLSEQAKIAAILSSVDEAIASTQAVIDQTRKIKQGLLQQLLTRGIGHTEFKESAIGEIPEEWEVVQIKDVAEFQPGYAFKSQDFSQNGDRLLRGSNVGIGKLIWTEDNTCYFPVSRRTEFTDYILEVGDIIVAMDRPFISEGFKIARVNQADLPALLLQRVGRFRFFNKIEREYLWFILQSRYVITHLKIQQKGSDLPHISKSEIEESLIPLPSLPEQLKIVQALSNVEAEIDKSVQLLKHLERTKRGLMQDLLTGKVRVGCTS